MYEPGRARLQMMAPEEHWCVAEQGWGRRLVRSHFVLVGIAFHNSGLCFFCTWVEAIIACCQRATVNTCMIYDHAG
jgi:hypothetical protein